MRIECEPAASRELSEYFSFQIPGARFMPAFKRGWSGRVSLYKKGLLYAGLTSKLAEFAEERDYKVVRLLEQFRLLDDKFDPEPFVQSLNIPTQYAPRDYQIRVLKEAVESRRRLFLSPVSSGKTMMLYLLARFFEEGRVLMVFPTTALVHQAAGDFLDYGYEGEFHKIVAGESKITDARIVLSTWQSIFKEDWPWINQFETVLFDECHTAQATSLRGICEAATTVANRFGFTGTLSGSKTHEMILEGLFGPVSQVITTRELMDQKKIAEGDVKMLTLVYPEELRKKIKKMDYQDEIEFLVSNETRNEYIKNLVLDAKGNTLLLCTKREKHAQILYENILKEAEGRPIFYIHGKIDGVARDEVRALIEKEDNAILVATFGVGAMGISIRRLHNLVLGSPYKSRIVVGQSLGRGLRMAEDKKTCQIFDIADDLSWGRRKNYALKHATERVKLYMEQGFRFRNFRIKL